MSTTPFALQYAILERVIDRANIVFKERRIAVLQLEIAVEHNYMDYQVGKIGRVVVAKFGDGEEVLGNLIDVAKKEDIKAAVVYLVGGMKKGRFVVGPETDEMPPMPVWRELNESHEIFGIGTIFWQGDEPKIHFHGAYGKRDNVKVGCLREDSEAFLILEAVIIEIEGVNATREFDPAIGLSLLRLGGV